MKKSAIIASVLAILAAIVLIGLYGGMTGYASKRIAMSNECEDTDGGSDFFVQGTMTYLDRGQEESLTDNCYESFLFFRSEAITGQYVKEYFCSGKKAYSKTYLCENGCADGACLEAA